MIRAISSDFKGEAGSNHSLAVFTELWGFESERDRRLYEELTPVPTRDSTRLVETYAGFHGESELLWELYERGVLEGRQLTAGELDRLTGCGLGAFEESQEADDPVPVWLDEPCGTTKPRPHWSDGVLHPHGLVADQALGRYSHTLASETGAGSTPAVAGRG